MEKKKQWQFIFLEKVQILNLLAKDLQSFVLNTAINQILPYQTENTRKKMINCEGAKQKFWSLKVQRVKMKNGLRKEKKEPVNL